MNQNTSFNIGLTFEINHEKNSIIVDTSSTFSRENVNEARKIIEEIGSQYPKYQIFSKIDPHESEKIKNLDDIGFVDYISLIKMDRPIDPLVDIKLDNPPNIAWRLLDINNELELWYSLVVSGYEGAPEFRGFSSFESWKKLIVDNDGNFLPDTIENGVIVLELNGEPIGNFAMAHQEAKTRQGWPSTFGINPAHRGKGYGEFLMRTYFYLEALRGSKTCTLIVSEKNLVALSLYKKLGYISQGQIKIIKEYLRK